jgi:hypothetical protein
MTAPARTQQPIPFLGVHRVQRPVRSVTRDSNRDRFLAAALIAALFGIGAFGDYSWPGARNVVYLFLVLAGLSVVFGTGVLKKSA